MNCAHGCEHAERRNCPECGALVEHRFVTVGLYYGMRGVEFKLGPEHERRCPHWRSAEGAR